MTRFNAKAVGDPALLDAIEAAALDTGAWGPLVDKLLTLFDGEGGGINIADLATGRSRAAINHGLSASAEDDYYAHLIRKDPRIPLMFGQASGSAFDDAPLLADGAGDRDEYYAWQAEQGYRHTLFFKLVHSADELGAIAVTRRNGRGAHDADALAAARALAPQLAGAAAIGRHIAALEGLNAGLERAMAAGARAFGLYGADTCLIHANPAYRAALDRRDGLGNGALSSAVLTALVDRRPAALLLRRSGGGTPYRLVLQPVVPAAAEQRGFDWGRRGAVLTFLDDPDAIESGTRVPVLRALFGLTGADARIAVLIADGHEVEAIAAQLQIAASTVRTQLKGVFQKLGVNRQLGVARLVRGLPQFDA